MKHDPEPPGEFFRPLDRSFFARSGMDTARDLLGTILVRRVDGAIRRARLIDVEAYLGPQDLASHSSRGRTPRTEVMFGPPGHAYVYFIYGMHWMFNVVVGTEGGGEALLIRGAQPLDGWAADLSGPAKLARAFGITRCDNGRDVTGGDIRFLYDPGYRPRVVRTKRVGIDYARHWKDRLLRFVDVAAAPAARRIRGSGAARRTPTKNRPPGPE